MSINLPSRCLTRSAQSIIRLSSSPLHQRRSYAYQSKPDSGNSAPVPPVIAEALKRKSNKDSNSALLRPRGELDSASSIFTGVDTLSEAQDGNGQPIALKPNISTDSGTRNMGVLAPTLDPAPSARERWQRKMVIRNVRRRGRLNKTETILRTERQSLSKSHFFKTSVKKLMPLARQIAGKDIDDAILQMRFSKKKVARDVLKHLKHAKNTAIVRHGMGLGPANPYVKTFDEEDRYWQRNPLIPDEDEDIARHQQRKERKVAHKTNVPLKLLPTPMFQPKDPNPGLTKMYVSQAWVGRGPYGSDVEFRARGRVNRLRLPYTSISIELKEEKTRVRLEQEKKDREEKKKMRNLWTQLPDRKITAQRPYYCW